MVPFSTYMIHQINMDVCTDSKDTIRTRIAAHLNSFLARNYSLRFTQPEATNASLFKRKKKR